MISCYDEKDSFQYENGFYLTSDTYRMGNILAHYELYKKIINLPGDVIEVGVFKGSSLIQFCTFRELLENERSRKIIGFDMFGEFPQVEKVESDKAFVNNWNAKFSHEYLSQDDLYKSLEYKGIHNVELIKGDVCSTLEAYLNRESHTRIALLHIDVDVYEPTKKSLELLYNRVVEGGCIVFDDYSTVEGETIAIEEFFEKIGQPYVINKFPFSHSKPSYIIKKAI